MSLKDRGTPNTLRDEEFQREVLSGTEDDMSSPFLLKCESVGSHIDWTLTRQYCNLNQKFIDLHTYKIINFYNLKDV